MVLASVAPGMPAEYQALYDELDGNLAAWERCLPGGGVARPPVWAAELVPANGNRGEDLLAPQAFEGCLLYLDALQRLGVLGVKIAIPYPLLDPAYPRSGEYLAFYRRLAAEVRRRGMVVLVGTGAAFTDPNFSKVRVDYRAMPFARFREGRRRVAHRIASEVEPDYLTVGSEPTTEAGITGFASLTDLAQYAETIRYMVHDLSRGATRIGAGTGNWESSAFVHRLAALSGRKGLVIGEAWLYKVRAAELARTGPAEALRPRCVFLLVPAGPTVSGGPGPLGRGRGGGVRLTFLERVLVRVPRLRSGDRPAPLACQVPEGC